MAAFNISGPLPVEEGRPELALVRDELFKAEKQWNERCLALDDQNRKLEMLRKVNMNFSPVFIEFLHADQCLDSVC